MGGHLPQQAALSWLTIVPIAESRSSYNGLLLFVLIAAAATHRVLCHSSLGVACHSPVRAVGLRISGCKPGDAIHGGQLCAADSTRIRNLVFHAREEIHMPAPGDPRPARFHVHLRDRVWDAFYAPVDWIVGVTATGLNRLQFLTCAAT